ncbi:uncharacterized protein ACIB01_012020 [Guaruba guarouba]
MAPGWAPAQVRLSTIFIPNVQSQQNQRRQEESIISLGGRKPCLQPNSSSGPTSSSTFTSPDEGAVLLKPFSRSITLLQFSLESGIPQDFSTYSTLNSLCLLECRNLAKNLNQEINKPTKAEIFNGVKLTQLYTEISDRACALSFLDKNKPVF